MSEAVGSRLEIALIAEERSTYLGLGYSEEHCAALAHEGEIQAVANTLKELGHHVTVVPGIGALIHQLAADKHKDWNLAFNMAQGFHGSARESQIPALLEAYQIPYTFADAATMALCQNKANTKIILQYHKIPTAPFIMVPTNNLGMSLPEFTTLMPPGPLFLKPVTEGSSKGIGSFNKVSDVAEFKMAVRKLAAKFPGQDILVESFLSGREVTVSILGTGTSGRVIGVREHLWQAKNRNGYASKLDFASREAKSCGPEVVAYTDTPDMTDPQIKAACQVALDAWNVLGCRDAGRVDIRFDSGGPDSVPNVLEVNPISGLLPSHSPLPSSAEANGIPFGRLLAGIIESALGHT